MAHDELLTEVRRLAARTLQLSDDIVRVAHAESRPLNPAPAALSDLLDEVLSDFRPQALSAEVTLQARAHDAHASWVIDRPLVVRALGNLLSNAIKHSPRGGVVEVRSALHEGGLALAVSDAGPGLSAEQRQKLKSEAQGLPAGDARGVGLGLLFVQRVAARHRGQLVTRVGAGGAGTTFELQLGELPVQPSSA
jgi:signal transduction histidine kinase